jgi:hypothetical protein
MFSTTNMFQGEDGGDRSDTPRAFLTPGERNALRDDGEMNENTRATHLSRIRRKIPKLREDARLLREQHDELSAEVQEAVCEEYLDERLARIELRLDRVETHIGLRDESGATGDS